MKNAYLIPLLTRARDVEKEIASAFSDLNEEQLNWKPGPGQWSVGQCIDHLITTNALYFPLFENARNGKSSGNFWEKIPLLPGILGKSIIKSLHPETKKKTKTFPVFEPAQSDIPSDIVARFKDQNNKMLDLMESLDHLDHEKIIITSPAARFVTYSLKDACTIIVTHEERHFLQARRVMQLAGFPMT